MNRELTAFREHDRATKVDMGGALGLRSFGAIAAHELAARSRTALDAPLEEDAELWLAEPADEAVLLGCFQRGCEVTDTRPLARRGSGGAAVLVGPGSLWLGLALAHPAALVACDASKLLNRHVRPLLRALTKVGCDARYFGRDWVSIKHRPGAALGFAHDAQSGRSFVEALIAVRTPFALGARGSFLGHEPGTLESIVGNAIDVARLRDAIVGAYGTTYERTTRSLALATPPLVKDEEELRADPPWRATREEALGVIAAGPDARGVLRLGGELLASRDAVANVERDVAALGRGASPTEVERIVTRAFTAPGVATLGVRSFARVSDVLVHAT
jgi:hypothetical protein